MRSLLLVGSFLILSLAAAASPKDGRAEIHRLIETRNGRTSCWGVTVELKKSTFYRRIARHELSIVEAKHGAELKRLMTWSVGKSRKVLTIRFKRGRGDFGTGNKVTVTINPSALEGFPQAPITVSISTDLH